MSLTKPPFGVRSCEVAIIWPDIIAITVKDANFKLFLRIPLRWWRLGNDTTLPCHAVAKNIITYNDPTTKLQKSENTLPTLPVVPCCFGNKNARAHTHTRFPRLTSPLKKKKNSKWPVNMSPLDSIRCKVVLTFKVDAKMVISSTSPEKVSSLKVRFCCKAPTRGVETISLMYSCTGSLAGEVCAFCFLEQILNETGFEGEDA